MFYKFLKKVTSLQLSKENFSLLRIWQLYFQVILRSFHWDKIDFKKITVFPNTTCTLACNGKYGNFYSFFEKLVQIFIVSNFYRDHV